MPIGTHTHIYISIYGERYSHRYIIISGNYSSCGVSDRFYDVIMVRHVTAILSCLFQ